MGTKIHFETNRLAYLLIIIVLLIASTQQACSSVDTTGLAKIVRQGYEVTDFDTMNIIDATYSSPSDVYIMGTMTSSTLTGSAFLISIGTDGTLNYAMTYNCTYLLKSLTFDSSTSSVYFKCSPDVVGVWIAKIDASDGSVISLTERDGDVDADFQYNDMAYNPVNNKIYFNVYFDSPYTHTGICDLDFN